MDRGLSLFRTPGIAAIVAGLLLVAGTPPVRLSAQSPSEDIVIQRYGRTTVITTAASEIVTDYEGDWPEEARAAHERAAARVIEKFATTVPITVDASWEDLGDSFVGMGGSGAQFLNFPNAPRQDTFYPSALANQYAGRRLGGDPDIRIALNSRTTWEYGDMPMPGSGIESLQATSMHEIIHGMGFLGTATVEGGVGCLGSDVGAGLRLSPYHGGKRPRILLTSGKKYGIPVDPASAKPDAWDVHVVTGEGTRLVEGDIPNCSQEMAAVLTGGNLFWGGRGARQAYGDRPRLYAPQEWQSASSYAHLDAATFDNGGPDAMLTPEAGTLNTLEWGPVTLAIMGDIGWSLR